MHDYETYLFFICTLWHMSMAAKKTMVNRQMGVAMMSMILAASSSSKKPGSICASGVGADICGNKIKPHWGIWIKNITTSMWVLLVSKTKDRVFVTKVIV